MRCTIVWIGLILAAGWSEPAAARLPVQSLRFVVGFGVQENLSPEREILALWKRYLTEPSDSLRATLWSSSERSTGGDYDLLLPYVYQGFTRFAVVDLGPAADLPNTYVLRTLVTAVEDSTLDVRPLALYRVYATQENGRWVLANALPRTTRDWERVTIGKVTFVYPPKHAFDRRRASATAAFVDSLARAFERPTPDPITFYFTDDLAETLRALGLEFFPLGGDPVGGRSNVAGRHAYVGSATHGESYRHELAHIVLAPEISSQTHRLVSEGLMTWTGGSAGLDYAELLPALAQYLSDHPELSLQGVLENPPLRRGGLDVGYSGLAVLCNMVFDGAGLPGLRALLSAGQDPATIVSSAANQLRLSPAELESRWRKECGVR
ncbi:MAG: hypothetical protein ACREOU_06020 [Candidatus Eiseniibacteriota bacterium]